MKEKMLPCPFCGSEDISYDCGLSTLGGGLFWMNCDDCYATGPQKQTKKGAAVAWNKRSEQ